MSFGGRASWTSSWHLQLALWFLLSQQFLFCLADNDTNPMSIFYTRPDLETPIITIDKIEPSLVTPGYLFFGVYQAAQDAPLIYDKLGNLVWNGFGAAGPGIVHAIHVCNYMGEPHLCYYQGVQMLGYGKGHGVIMDNHYQIVKTIDPAGSSMTVDLHEFNLTPDGKSALMTIYHPMAYDLHSYGIKDGMGWIQESRFQEVDVETGKLVFEWRSLDHIDPSESFVLPDTTEISGDGSTKDTPWDYFHINSIDKNEDGDYLISARHVSTVYKISGKDGSLMWRLNGKKSDYKLNDFTFSSQHDARWVSENSTHTVLSLYDNASNGFNHTFPQSRGMIITMDHKTKEANLLKDYRHPSEHGQLAKSQGNTQILDNGHVVQGWGPLCDITEHLADGTTVFSGWAARTGMMIYRVYKANWTAEPFWDPSVYAYSKEQNTTAYYASWNGATEVTHWNFYGSMNRDGPFNLVKTVEKTGFESWHIDNKYAAYVYAEALHEHDVLRKSPIEATFSPSDALRASCDDFKCRVATKYSAEKTEDGSIADKQAEMEAERIAKMERLEKLEREARAERARILAERRKRRYQLAGISALITVVFLLSRKTVRNVLFVAASTVREAGADLARCRAPRPFRRDYAQLPIMTER